MKNPTLLPLTALFLIAGLCLLGCETTSPVAIVETFTVSFNSNEGSAVESRTVTKDAKVDKPTDPTRDGFTFDGWYTDEATTLPYDFTTATVTANLTLYAKWVADAVETFTVSFNSNEGSAVESRTVTEGEKVAKPDAPTRDGYTFDDWYIAGATSPYNFDEAVKANFTLQARWLSQATDLSLTYDGQAVTPTQNNFAIAVASTVDVAALSLTFTVATGAQLREGSTTIALSNSTVTKEFDFSVNKTKTFNVRAEDGTTQATYTVTVTVQLATAKEITRFSFLAANNTALSADVEATLGEDTIKAVLPAGTAVTSLTPTIVHTGASINPEAGVVQDFSNDVTYTVTAQNEDTKTYTVRVRVLQADEQSYTVRFVTPADATAVNNQTVVEGEMADSPPDPSRENYRFDGWYRTANGSGDVYDFTTTAVAEDITLYAKWVRRYTVTFDTDNKATAINAVMVDSATKVSSPEVIPNAGYTFDDWYTSAAKTTAYNFDDPVISEITLYAGLNAVVGTYTVNFNSEGTVIDSKTVNEGDAVQQPTDPERDGYTFDGWYTDEATTIEYDFTTATVTANMTLYAKWVADAVETFTVRFNSNEGSTVEPRTVNKDEKVDQPTDPERDGYTFDGWYTDEATTIEYDFTTATVTANMTLYAKWVADAVETFTVSFNSNEGSTVEPRTVNKDAKVDQPTDPERDGYTFEGWYTDEATTIEYDFTTATVTADITLYAKWVLFTKSLAGLSALTSPTVPVDIETYPPLVQGVLKPYTAGAALVFKFLKVGATGTEDATSWDNAGAGDGAGLKDTLDAITDAATSKVYVVLLAGGVYTPAATLSMKNHVAIVGGFSATTNWARTFSDTTRLDGNNDKQVVVNRQLSNTALLYGVTIARGSSADNGGGMYNDSSNPVLTNVTFSGNSANGGGGMYSGAGSSPILTNITFSNNSASISGGGIYMSGDYSILTNVTFSGNSAQYGGAIYSTRSNPTLTDVAFSGNSATARGGGMYNATSSSSFTNVTFSGNSADNDGGGLFNYNSSPILVDVTFSNNSATARGGGMFNNASSSPNLTKVTFSENSGTSGGGMYNNDRCRPTLTNVTFSNNSATNGGGLFNYTSSPSLTKVTFSNNSATARGGGIYNFTSSYPILTNVTFFANSASFSGGGIYSNDRSRPTLTNVTFSNNSASSGGGIFNQNLSSSVIVNSIFWGNTATSEGAQIYQDGDTVSIHNSVLQGDTTAIALNNGGAFNASSLVTTDPLGSNTLADNGGNVQTIAIASGSAAQNIGLYLQRGSDGTLYYSTDNATWYTAFTHKDGLSGTTATPPADAIAFTATDATGYTRAGRPDAGAYEAR